MSGVVWRPSCIVPSAKGEKRGDAIILVQRGVGELRDLVRKDSDELQKHVEEHWLRMCQHMCTFLVERVEKVREAQIRESRGVVGLYVNSWEYYLKRIKLLLKEPSRTGNAQIEKLRPGSVDNE